MENTTEKKSNEFQEEQERCFVIMPISDQRDYPKGHFTKVYNQIFKPAIIAAGYEPFRVDEDKISNPIINKIFDAVQNCPMALCDLSNRNPNVLYELGLCQAYDKPVVLVQDEKTPRIFDVSGINTVQYSSERLFENVMEAREKITDALISTRDGRDSIAIETNPSSNYLIGTIQKYDEHPILRFNSRKLRTPEKNMSLSVSINTDDQGVFDTLLENEYALMTLALKKSKDKDNQPLYDIEDIYEWVDYVREMGLEQSFK